MISRRSAKRLRAKGEPVFAFVDRDVSDEPFLVDRVPFDGRDEIRSLVAGLIDLAWGFAGGSPANVVYVTDPAGEAYEVGSFETDHREAEWVARLKELVVEQGAAGLALVTQNRQFRDRYGGPDRTPTADR